MVKIISELQQVNIFNLFLITSAIIGFIFSLVLFFSKNGKERSMVYLNLLVLSISLNNLQSWILAENLFQHKFTLDYIQIPWHFLLAPFFYMFLKHYLEINVKSCKILKLIILLFIITIITQVYFVIQYSKNVDANNLEFFYERYTSIEEIISFIISMNVFSYAFFVLYKKENLFPKILSFDNLRWIYLFFIIGAIGYTLWFIALVIKVKMNFTGFIFSYFPLRIYTTVLIFWLGYQSVIKIRLLKERRSLRAILSTKTSSEIILTEEKTSEEFNKVHNYILANKKFAETKVSRGAIAEELGMSKSKFSTLINNNANKSFIDYMNELRVEQAKQLLANKEYNNYTTTAVGLESGFNSKSTFYHIFKKYTGKTPSEYRQKN